MVVVAVSKASKDKAAGMEVAKEVATVAAMVQERAEAIVAATVVVREVAAREVERTAEWGVAKGKDAEVVCTAEVTILATDGGSNEGGNGGDRSGDGCNGSKDGGDGGGAGERGGRDGCSLSGGRSGQ